MQNCSNKRKYKNVIKNADISKKFQRHYSFFSDFLKLNKVLSICFRFQVFGIVPSKIMYREGVILPTPHLQEPIKGQNTKGGNRVKICIPLDSNITS